MGRIPVIDISDSNKNAAAQLLAAATDNGFVFIENNAATGISEHDIRSMFGLSKDFFASDSSIKAECAINSKESGKNRGWLGMHGETLDPAKQKRGDFKEAFNFSANAPPQPLSGPLSHNRTGLLSFQSKCHNLCVRILDLFGQALDIEPTWFGERHDQSKGETGSILRLLYYPSLHRLAHEQEQRRGEKVEVFDDGVDVRAGAHSDYGSVTLLFQQKGQPGLEIFTREGTWEGVPVDPVGTGPLPILVNIGDLLSFWTNGLLKSTVHRVIFPSTATEAEQLHDRYSMAYFCHPLDEAELVPVPSRLVREMSGTEEARREMDKVRGLGGEGVGTARGYLEARLGATYAAPKVGS